MRVTAGSSRAMKVDFHNASSSQERDLNVKLFKKSTYRRGARKRESGFSALPRGDHVAQPPKAADDASCKRAQVLFSTDP